MPGGPPTHYASLAPADSNASATNSPADEFSNRVRGHLKALVAVARSILVTVWHLLNDPTARYRDLGPDWHTKNLDPARKTRDLVRQLTALGHDVTLTPAGA
ncbi:hypothetical protein [Streptomyces spongiicola]|uniref:hypothetical protein n=1 Tax=Streptomyces spongiicola TaxID=1690221 RepID=UPI0013A55F38|nr:hypothetical protein [Streptomyces spongiicola]